LSRVLVTGANGFVGRHLCAMLKQRGHYVRAALRSTVADAAIPANEVCQVGDLGPETDWGRAVDGMDSVVHLAAKAHVLDQPHDDGEYHRINALGTRGLAQSASRGGIRRFVFLSSIKVYGEARDRAFRVDEEPQPVDVYGKSKLSAELYLRDSAASSNMEAVIVRPPLVYGPRVRANFLRLMQWVDRRVPLPLGAVHNSRSLVALDNLCDFLGHALEHPSAANNTWLVSDGDDVSTPELIRRIARAMKRRAYLLPVPPVLLRAAGKVVGRAEDVTRLCGSLTLDIASTRRTLGWNPLITQDVAIASTVRWYLESRNTA